MSTRQRTHPEHVDIVINRFLRGFLRRLEQRPDIDIEADISEGRGYHLLAAVVPVLPQLGYQNTRPATFSLDESLDQSANLHDGAHRLPHLFGINAARQLRRRLEAAIDFFKCETYLAHRSLQP